MSPTSFLKGLSWLAAFVLIPAGCSTDAPAVEVVPEGAQRSGDARNSAPVVTKEKSTTATDTGTTSREKSSSASTGGNEEPAEKPNETSPPPGSMASLPRVPADPPSRGGADMMSPPSSSGSEFPPPRQDPPVMPMPPVMPPSPPVAETKAISFASALTGWRWELPCADKNARDTCPWSEAGASGDPAQVPGFSLARRKKVKFGGDPTKTYQVTLHIRGLTEPKTFTGGQVRETHFQIGGTPNTNDYNTYTIQTAAPGQTYTVNRSPNREGHYTIVLDYKVTIPIQGGSEITLGTSDPNKVAIANPGGGGTPKVVPGIAPFPAAYPGQFIQLDVTAVTEGP